MEIIILIIGIILLLGGIALNISINRRRFYRRGPGGLQHFESYGKAVGTTFLERIGKIIAFLLIVIGLFFTISYFLLPDLKREIQRQQNLEQKGK
ncbi:molybdenum ABC transporter permease [Sphingobacterium thalpophilum]|uniref:molybdenum ABC transporter permease n=1 Tax=Sphingobacterium thalpophilum TaxID=259 RepID=UPI003D97AA26